MSDLNQVTVTGRLGADPEIRSLQDGRKVANLRVAVSQTWRDKNSGERRERTEWIPVTIFSDGLCRVVEAYLRKGSRVLVQGNWQTRKYEKDGIDRYTTELVLQAYGGTLIMLDGKRDGDTADSYGSQQAAPAPAGGMGGGAFDADSEIPF